MKRQVMVDSRVGSEGQLLASSTPRFQAGQSLGDFLLVYRWYWKSRLPERHGQLCVVHARGRMNSVQVEFLIDGVRHITSRFAIRRARSRAVPLQLDNAVGQELDNGA